MLEAVIKLWPIIASLVAFVAGFAVWIGANLVKLTRWTAEHDSRVAAMRVDVDKLEGRIGTVEHATQAHAVALARIEAKL
jgi:hypothetical protein